MGNQKRALAANMGDSSSIILTRRVIQPSTREDAVTLSPVGSWGQVHVTRCVYTAWFTELNNETMTMMEFMWREKASLIAEIQLGELS